MKQSIFLLALIATAPSFAQNAYVTGQIGSADHEVSVDSVSIKDSDTAVLVAAGYRFTPNFAFEAGYAHLGEFKKTEGGNTIYAKPKTFYGAVVGSFNATPAIALHAKLGVARSSTEVGYSSLNEAGSSDEHKTHIVAGVGASYAFTPSIAAVAEYHYFGKIAEDKPTQESLKSSMISAGVRFSF